MKSVSVMMTMVLMAQQKRLIVMLLVRETEAKYVVEPAEYLYGKLLLVSNVIYVS